MDEKNYVCEYAKYNTERYREGNHRYTFPNTDHNQGGYANTFIKTIKMESTSYKA